MLPVLQQWEPQVLPLLGVSSPNTYLFRCFSSHPNRRRAWQKPSKEKTHEIFRRNQNFLYNYWSRISSLRWQCICPNTSLEEQIYHLIIVRVSDVNRQVGRQINACITRVLSYWTMHENRNRLRICLHPKFAFASRKSTDVNQLATIGINLVKAKSGMSASKFSIILNIIATFSPSSL